MGRDLCIEGLGYLVDEDVQCYVAVLTVELLGFICSDDDGDDDDDAKKKKEKEER